MNYADRVQETTAATTTSTITLSGAVSPMRSFAAAFTGGTTDIPVTVADTTGKFESGMYTLTAANTLTRTSLVDSSNGGAAETFGAGSKTVTCTVHAKELAKMVVTKDIAFTTTIPLTQAGSTYIAASTVTGALTFTVGAGAVRGALAYLRLTADGVNTPNFAAFKEWGGSSGYDNRNGIVNQLQFFYDGSDLFYSASQAVGAVPTATAVTMTGPTGGVVNVVSGNFTVGTNSARTAAVVVTPTAVSGVTFSPTSVTLPIGSATATFTATPTTTGAKTIAVTNNASLSNAANITYTVTAAATAPAQMAKPVATAGNGTVSVAYVAPADGGSAIQSYTATWSGGQSVTGTATPLVITGVTNGVAGTATMTATNAVGTSPASPASDSVTPVAVVTTSAPRLSSLSSDMTESATAPWVYTATGAAFGGAIGGVSTLSLPANTDGSFEIQFTGHTSGTAEVMLIAKSTSSLDPYTAAPTAIYTYKASSKYMPITNGNLTSATATTSVDGDKLRIRRAGTTLIAEVSKDNRATWIEQKTWTGQPTGILYFQVAVGTGAGTVTNLVGVGLV